MIGSMRRGGLDPCHHRATDGTVWRTSRMRSGPVTCRLWQRGPREIHAQVWGVGGEEFHEQLPRMLGADDDPAGFDPVHPLVVDADRRFPGLRILRTGRVLEALVPAILEQKVTGMEARGEWVSLVRRYGDPAPGPVPRPMWVVPEARTWLTIPSWEWHRAGVDPKRAATVVRALRVIGRLEECDGLGIATAHRRMLAVPGIGPWTVAEVSQRAFGDPDTVSVGDYHLASFIGWNLIGRKVDDDGMLELLEPWRGHRYRLVRLLELSPRAAMPERHGPRMSIQDHRRH
jgi:3-methyladenine DNA glycosylase/8-oxoguanine DNA glycosylase